MNIKKFSEEQEKCFDAFIMPISFALNQDISFQRAKHIGVCRIQFWVIEVANAGYAELLKSVFPLHLDADTVIRLGTLNKVDVVPFFAWSLFLFSGFPIERNFSAIALNLKTMNPAHRETLYHSCEKCISERFHENDAFRLSIFLWLLNPDLLPEEPENLKEFDAIFAKAFYHKTLGAIISIMHNNPTFWQLCLQDPSIMHEIAIGK
jgi:hypothetical protein